MDSMDSIASACLGNQTCLPTLCKSYAATCETVRHTVQETQRQGLQAPLTAQCRPLERLRSSRSLRCSQSSILTATWQCSPSHP